MKPLSVPIRLALLALMAVATAVWFHAFPLKRVFHWDAIAVAGLRVAILTIGYFFITPLRVRLLEAGWVLLIFAELFNLLDDFTTEPRLVSTVLSGSLELIAILLVAIGFFSAWRQWRVELEHARHLESAHRDGEERFRRLAETTNVIPWEASLDRARISYVGPQAVQLIGFPERLWHEPNFWFSRLHADDRATAVRLNADFARDRAEFDLEYRLVTADGRAIWFRDHVTVVPDAHGGPPTLRGFLIDITERSQAVIALQNTVSLLRATLDSTADGILVVDAAGKIVSHNERFATMWRIPTDVLAARDDQKAIESVLAQLREPEVFLAKVRELYSQPAAESLDVLEFKDGRAFERHSRPQLLNGKPIGRVWSFHDVSDRRRAAETFQRERNLLRTLVDGLPDCIYIKDRSGRILLTNEANARLLNLKSTAEFEGKTVFDFFPEPEARIYAADDERVIATGEPVLHREEPFTSAAGRAGWFLTTKFPLRDEQGKIIGLVGISRDITEQRRAAEERNRVDRKMQEAQKLESLGVLAGGIAHDFNNLLTGVLGNASLGKMQVANVEKARQCFAEIEAAALRAADLCKQMLAYSGRGRFIVQKLDLSALVEDTKPLLHVSTSKKAAFDLHLARALPPVMADATQLRQILMNLVINASESIGDHPGVITVTTGQMFADKNYFAAAHLAPDLPEGDYVFLEVSDTGGGMTPDVLPRIFDPFFTTKFTGRGLGLAAVLGIVRGHNGALKVVSEPGQGSTFRLLLPADVGRPEPARAVANVAPGWRGRGTVLVVDDEESVRKVCGHLVRAFGFDALEAVNGRDGLAKFRAGDGKIVAVLLDLTMPEMDGEECFRELRVLRAGIPVVLMSGFSEDEATARFAGQGLAGFVQKPFTPDGLREKLQACVKG